MKNPILDLIKEHKLTESVRKIEIHAELLGRIKNLSIEEQTNLIKKLDESGLSLILSCGLKKENYALAIKRLYSLKQKSKKKEVI